jgi:hypothetical protein
VSVFFCVLLKKYTFIKKIALNNFSSFIISNFKLGFSLKFNLKKKCPNFTLPINLCTKIVSYQPVRFDDTFSVDLIQSHDIGLDPDVDWIAAMAYS